jgi:glutamine cyclotransferase
VRFYRVQVVRRVPHPGRGFTQGLIADGDTIWESTGLYGQSTLTRYRLGGSEPAARALLPPEVFGEGICRAGDSIWQLTWKERVALRWDTATLELRDRIRYNREGWGMCAIGAGGMAGAGAGDGAGGEIVTSDGTSELVCRDPGTLEPRAVVHVRCQGERVSGLNDLAWDGTRVWANVAGTSCLAGIDLGTGEVTDVADARRAAEGHIADPQAIMNGIAALGEPGEFLLTGKRWRSVRQARLIPDRDRHHVERLLDGLSRLSTACRKLAAAARRRSRRRTGRLRARTRSTRRSHRIAPTTSRPPRSRAAA